MLNVLERGDRYMKKAYKSKLVSHCESLKTNQSLMDQAISYNDFSVIDKYSDPVIK